MGTVREALQAMATRRGALEQLNVRALITREFERYDPAYLVHKALREQRLNALKRKLISSEKDSKVLPCSRRMMVEAEWLLNYTAEWAKLDRQLTGIEHSLRMLSQIGETGAYQREELNALEGALSQLLFKGKLRTLLQANGASFPVASRV